MQGQGHWRLWNTIEFYYVLWYVKPKIKFLHAPNNVYTFLVTSHRLCLNFSLMIVNICDGIHHSWLNGPFTHLILSNTWPLHVTLTLEQGPKFCMSHSSQWCTFFVCKVVIKPLNTRTSFALDMNFSCDKTINTICR
jgi:hypothetical protein